MCQMCDGKLLWIQTYALKEEFLKNRGLWWVFSYVESFLSQSYTIRYKIRLEFSALLKDSLREKEIQYVS